MEPLLRIGRSIEGNRYVRGCVHSADIGAGKSGTYSVSTACRTVPECHCGCVDPKPIDLNNAEASNRTNIRTGPGRSSPQHKRSSILKADKEIEHVIGLL